MKSVAITPSTSAHEMVSELMDDEIDAEIPSGGGEKCFCCI